MFHPIVPRDTEKEVRAWMEPYVLHAISWITAMEKMGVDPEAEEARLRQEGRWPPWELNTGGGENMVPSHGGMQFRSPTKDIERAMVNDSIGAQ